MPVKELITNLNGILAKYTDGPNPKLPGTVAIAVASEGEMVYLHEGGMLTRLSTEPFTKDTLCIMASLAKLVTTIAILQCVEKSLIALDDPVEQILLELADPDILEGFSDEGKPILRKANEKITLRMLLSHSSGLSYSENEPTIQRYDAYNKYFRDDFRKAKIEAFVQPLVFEPGTRWAYGPGLEWAGLLVGRLNGTTLENFIRSTICSPLSISSLSFRPLHPEKVAPMNGRQSTSIEEIPRLYPLSSAEDMGGLGLYSNASDYAKLVSEVLTILCHDHSAASSRLKLSSSLLSEIFSPQLGTFPQAEAAYQALASESPGRLGAGHLPHGSGVACGLATTVTSEDVPGMRKKGSAWWYGMPGLSWWVDPASDVVGVVFS